MQLSKSYANDTYHSMCARYHVIVPAADSIKQIGALELKKANATVRVRSSFTFSEQVFYFEANVRPSCRCFDQILLPTQTMQNHHGSCVCEFNLCSWSILSRTCQSDWAVVRAVP
jgi:hypothetical protein